MFPVRAERGRLSASVMGGGVGWGGVGGGWGKKGGVRDVKLSGEDQL